MSTGVGCHFLLWRVFLTQGSNPGLPHCRQMLYHLGHQGSGKTTTRTLAYRVRPPRGESPQCCWHSSPCRSTEAGRRELSPRAADNSKRGGQWGATGETRRPWWAGLEFMLRTAPAAGPLCGERIETFPRPLLDILQGCRER